MAITRMSRTAIKDARLARQWYEQRSPTAAVDFEIELADAVRRISDFPLAWIVCNTRGERRCRFATFPYSVIFRIRRAEVWITAVRHDRRAPT